MNKKHRRWCSCLTMLLTLQLTLAVAHSRGEQPADHQHPATLQQAPDPAAGLDEHLGAKLPLDVVFRNETGQVVTLDELVNGPTIILPVYYGCSNVCNFLQGGLARVLPQIKARPDQDYRVISISFDDSETPSMAARAKRLHLGSITAPFPADGWHFLTGDSAAIQRLTSAAGYRFQRRGRDFIHPTASLVVAGDGTIVRYLYGTSFLAKDVSLALLEAREGRVGRTVASVVEYCFSFDPTAKTYVFNLLRVSATVVILCAGSFLAFLVLGRKRGKGETRGRGKGVKG